MRKLSFLTVLLVGGFLWWSGVFTPATKGIVVSPSEKSAAVESNAAVDALSSQSAAPSRSAESSAQNATLEGEPAAPSAALMMPKRFFPEAPVVSYTESRNAKGEILLVKTVETKREQPYIRVEETYREIPGGGRELVDHAAMVANQLLVDKPETLGDEAFASMLEQAGASTFQKKGIAYLVTFPADPKNPKALDGFRSKLASVSKGAIVIEPNYIRRIF